MSCLRKVGQKLLILLVTLIFFLILPLIFLAFLPMYVCRYFVFQLSKIFRSSEGKMLCTYASLFASDKIFEKPLCNLIVIALVDGKLKIDQLRELVQTKLLDKRLQHHLQQQPVPVGELAYPELRQYISRWLFYNFWTWDRDFSLDQYVREYDGKYREDLITDDKVSELVNELNNKPYRRKMSPWEMVLLTNVQIKNPSQLVEGRDQLREKVLVSLNMEKNYGKDKNSKTLDSSFYPPDKNPFINMKVSENKIEQNGSKNPNNTYYSPSCKNYTGSEAKQDGDIIKGILEENTGQSMMIWRVHHCIGDGISIRNLLLDFIGYSRLKNPTNNHEANNRKPKSPSPCEKLVSLYKCISFPFVGVYQSIAASFECFDENQWHIPEEKLTREMQCASSDPVSVDYIKAIKNRHDTTFNAAIIASITGGIRTFMIRNNFKVPENMHVLSPIPFKVSEKLRNHVTAAFLRLPVGLCNPEDRMKAVKKYLKAIKKSRVPQVNYLGFPILGGLIPSLTRKLYRQYIPTGVLSAFPGPDELVTIGGKAVTDIIFAGGMHKGNIGTGFCLLSYNGYLRILVGVDKAIFPKREMAEELIRDVEQEFENLKNCGAASAAVV